MSHVRLNQQTEPGIISPQERQQQMRQRRWQQVDVAVTEQDLINHFYFLNHAVLTRSSQEDVPLLTTRGLFGPISPNTSVILTPNEGTGVAVLPEPIPGETLIEQLDKLYAGNALPGKGYYTAINAFWTAAIDGGGLGGLSGAANVFGATGQLIIKDDIVEFPVIDYDDPQYHQTLAYYGGMLLKPNTPFNMGFDLDLWGIQYDTQLPDYIRHYEMSPTAGGGLFVEHHPFPHIFLPMPDQGSNRYCDSKILLGRLIDPDNKENPQYAFTVFRVPSDGSALTIRPGTIHNDSYTSGRQTVYLANTPANTVALRKSAPYTGLHLNDKPL